MPEITPQEIVRELDKHIVGQDAAKRSVAIALRNRWRRTQVPEALRNEITPKNILMIGPYLAITLIVSGAGGDASLAAECCSRFTPFFSLVERAGDLL